MYKCSSEEIEKQKKEFYEKYKSIDFTALYKHSPKETEEFMRCFYFLINVQNGQDIDDCWMHEEVALYKHARDKIVGKDVLILGTGTGREMRLARSLGAKSVKGTTLGRRNVKFAEEVVGESPVICDVHALPFDNEEFDVVAAYQVFEHSYAPPLFLLGCNRVMKIGGRIMLETPASKLHSYDSWLHHIICPTPRQMYYLFIKTGFKPVYFNGADISNLDVDKDDIPGIDNIEEMVYMEAIKQDPQTYDRGDIARYYTVLQGGKFRY